MTDISFENNTIAIVGGAGFVGSNLCKLILKEHLPKKVIVIDNLLSSEESNIPSDERVEFLKGSIANDDILSKMDKAVDFIFHLSTFHRNQSSIEDPIRDHENNTITTLKLMDFMKNSTNLKKLVYSAAGCSAAKKHMMPQKPPLKKHLFL